MNDATVSGGPALRTAGTLLGILLLGANSRGRQGPSAYVAYLARLNLYFDGDPMSDQLSRDLASLRIDRSSSQPPARPSNVIRWLVLAAVGAVVLVGYPKAKAEIENRLYQRAVTLGEVMMQSAISAQVDLTATGYVTAQVTAKVGSKVPGRIAKVAVQEGDTVVAGQILFELDPADERTALGSANARVRAAKARAEASRAELAEAEAQLQREQKLAETGALAPAVVEDRALRVEALRKQVSAVEAEAQVSQSEAHASGQQLRNLRIVAPIGGTAVTKPAQLGDVVGANFGAMVSLVELVDFESMLIEVDVPESRLGQVKRDAPCEVVLDAAPSERLRGKVADFAPRINRAKATATVKVKLVDRPQRLWPDMSARVSFLAKDVSDAQRKEPPKKIVQRSAVVNIGDQRFVWVVQERKVRKASVVTGQDLGTTVELVQGPEAGTQIVTAPPSDLSEGQSIKADSAANP